MITTEFWNLLVDAVATLLARLAILLYVIFFRDKTNNSYDVFDATYTDLLKIVMEYPSFRNSDFTHEYENAFFGDKKIRSEGLLSPLI